MRADRWLLDPFELSSERSKREEEERRQKVATLVEQARERIKGLMSSPYDGAELPALAERWRRAREASDERTRVLADTLMSLMLGTDDKSQWPGRAAAIGRQAAERISGLLRPEKLYYVPPSSLTWELLGEAALSHGQDDPDIRTAAYYLWLRDGPAEETGQTLYGVLEENVFEFVSRVRRGDQYAKQAYERLLQSAEPPELASVRAQLQEIEKKARLEERVLGAPSRQLRQQLEELRAREAELAGKREIPWDRFFEVWGEVRAREQVADVLRKSSGLRGRGLLQDNAEVTRLEREIALFREELQKAEEKAAASDDVLDLAQVRTLQAEIRWREERLAEARSAIEWDAEAFERDPVEYALQSGLALELAQVWGGAAPDIPVKAETAEERAVGEYFRKLLQKQYGGDESQPWDVVRKRYLTMVRPKEAQGFVPSLARFAAGEGTAIDLLVGIGEDIDRYAARPLAEDLRGLLRELGAPEKVADTAAWVTTELALTVPFMVGTGGLGLGAKAAVWGARLGMIGRRAYLAEEALPGYHGDDWQSLAAFGAMFGVQMSDLVFFSRPYQVFEQRLVNRIMAGRVVDGMAAAELDTVLKEVSRGDALLRERLKGRILEGRPFDDLLPGLRAEEQQRLAAAVAQLDVHRDATRTALMRLGSRVLVNAGVNVVADVPVTAVALSLMGVSPTSEEGLSVLKSVLAVDAALGAGLPITSEVLPRSWRVIGPEALAFVATYAGERVQGQDKDTALLEALGIAALTGVGRRALLRRLVDEGVGSRMAMSMAFAADTSVGWHAMEQWRAEIDGMYYRAERGYRQFVERAQKKGEDPDPVIAPERAREFITKRLGVTAEEYDTIIAPVVGTKPARLSEVMAAASVWWKPGHLVETEVREASRRVAELTEGEKRRVIYYARHPTVRHAVSPSFEDNPALHQLAELLNEDFSRVRPVTFVPRYIPVIEDGETVGYYLDAVGVGRDRYAVTYRVHPRTYYETELVAFTRIPDEVGNDERAIHRWMADQFDVLLPLAPDAHVTIGNTSYPEFMIGRDNQRAVVVSYIGEYPERLERPHYGPAVLYHLRLSDWLSPDWKRFLIVEEVQSDMAQAMQQEGGVVFVAAERPRLVMRMIAEEPELRRNRRIARLYQLLSEHSVQELPPEYADLYRHLARLVDGGTELLERGLPRHPMVRDVDIEAIAAWRARNQAVISSAKERPAVIPAARVWRMHAARRIVAEAISKEYDGIIIPGSEVHQSRWSGYYRGGAWYDRELPDLVRSVLERQVGVTPTVWSGYTRFWHTLEEARRSAVEMVQGGLVMARDRDGWWAKATMISYDVDEAKQRFRGLPHYVVAPPGMASPDIASELARVAWDLGAAWLVSASTDDEKMEGLLGTALGFGAMAAMRVLRARRWLRSNVLLQMVGEQGLERAARNVDGGEPPVGSTLGNAIAGRMVPQLRDMYSAVGLEAGWVDEAWTPQEGNIIVYKSVTEKPSLESVHRNASDDFLLMDLGVAPEEAVWASPYGAKAVEQTRGLGVLVAYEVPEESIIRRAKAGAFEDAELAVKADAPVVRAAILSPEAAARAASHRIELAAYWHSGGDGLLAQNEELRSRLVDVQRRLTVWVEDPTFAVGEERRKYLASGWEKVLEWARRGGEPPVEYLRVLFRGALNRLDLIAGADATAKKLAGDAAEYWEKVRRFIRENPVLVDETGHVDSALAFWLGIGILMGVEDAYLDDADAPDAFMQIVTYGLAGYAAQRLVPRSVAKLWHMAAQDRWASAHAYLGLPAEVEMSRMAEAYDKRWANKLRQLMPSWFRERADNGVTATVKRVLLMALPRAHDHGMIAASRVRREIARAGFKLDNEGRVYTEDGKKVPVLRRKQEVLELTRKLEDGKLSEEEREQIAERLASMEWWEEAKDRIIDDPERTVPSHATIADIAAAPLWYRQAGYITEQQFEALQRVARILGAYEEEVRRFGVTYQERPDIDAEAFGFYFPRGHAYRVDAEGNLIEETPIILPHRARFARGAEHLHAEFASQSEGIANGLWYVPYDVAVQRYVADALTESAVGHVVNWLKTLKDENGEPLVVSRWDRIRRYVEEHDAEAGRLGYEQWQKTVRRLAGRLRSAQKAVAKAERAVAKSEGYMQAVRKRLDELMESLRLRKAEVAAGKTRAAARAALAEDPLVEHLRRQVRTYQGRMLQAKRANSQDIARLETAKQRLQQLEAQKEYREQLLKAAEEATERPPEGRARIELPGLEQYDVPAYIHNALADFLVTHAKDPWAATISDVVNLIRTVRATADVSQIGVTSLLASYNNPRGALAAVKLAFALALIDHPYVRAVEAWEKKAQQEGLSLDALVRSGLRVMGLRQPFEEVIEGSTGKVMRYFSATALEQLAEAPKPAGEITRTAVRLSPFAASARHYAIAGDAMRVETFLSLYKALPAERKGDEAYLRKLAHAVNLMTGVADRGFGSQLPGSAGRIVQWAQFAPRFFQSTLEVVARAAADAGPEGAMLRAALLRMVGVGALLVWMANDLLGQETDFDPRSPNFLRIRLPGRDVSLFGPWDSLARGIISTANGIPYVEQVIPDREGQGGDVTYFARSKANPVVGIALDMMTGETFGRHDTNDWRYWRDQVLPFAASDIAETIQDDSPAYVKAMSAAMALLGLKQTPLTAWERVEEQMEAEGFDFDDPLQRLAWVAANPEKAPAPVTEMGKELQRVREQARQKMADVMTRWQEGQLDLAEALDELASLNREARAAIRVLLDEARVTSGWSGDPKYVVPLEEYFMLFDQARLDAKGLAVDYIDQMFPTPEHRLQALRRGLVTADQLSVYNRIVRGEDVPLEEVVKAFPQFASIPSDGVFSPRRFNELLAEYTARWGPEWVDYAQALSAVNDAPLWREYTWAMSKVRALRLSDGRVVNYFDVPRFEGLSGKYSEDFVVWARNEVEGYRRLLAGEGIELDMAGSAIRWMEEQLGIDPDLDLVSDIVAVGKEGHRSGVMQELEKLYPYFLAFFSGRTVTKSVLDGLKRQQKEALRFYKLRDETEVRFGALAETVSPGLQALLERIDYNR